MIEGAAVIARSDATKQSRLPLRPMDCFATLAMTSVRHDRRVLLHLAPLAGRGRIYAQRKSGGAGLSAHWVFVEAAPHPNPPRAGFARLDPAKCGAREQKEKDHSM